MSSYYEDELNSILPIDEYGVSIQLRSNGRSTKWMRLNEECVTALKGFIDRLPKEKDALQVAVEALKIAESHVECNCGGDYCRGTCDSAKIQDAIKKATT